VKCDADAPRNNGGDEDEEKRPGFGIVADRQMPFLEPIPSEFGKAKKCPCEAQYLGSQYDQGGKKCREMEKDIVQERYALKSEEVLCHRQVPGTRDRDEFRQSLKDSQNDGLELAHP